MNDEALVRVDDLHKQFQAVHAVRGLNFQINRGDVLGFLGCNGAGKSTTLAMLAGVMAADRGSVSINGHDLLLEPLKAKASLGYLPEIPPLYPEMLVRDYLHFCAGLRQIPKSQISQAVTAACERCDLGEVNLRLIGNLSKGYRQRVGIAQAIIHRPQLVILDEPTSGLDPQQSASLRELIIGLGEDHGVMLSTHNLSEAQSTCNRLLILHNGTLRLDSPLPATGESQVNSSRIYHLSFSKPPDPEVLAKLPDGITLLEVDGCSARISLNAKSNDTQPALERALGFIAQQPFGLTEINSEGNTLEQLFMRLTSGQDSELNHES